MEDKEDTMETETTLPAFKGLGRNDAPQSGAMRHHHFVVSLHA